MSNTWIERYNSPPLELVFVLGVFCNKQLRVMHPHLGLRLSRPLRTLPMLPLNLDQLNHFVPQGFCVPIQNRNRLLHII